MRTWSMLAALGIALAGTLVARSAWSQQTSQGHRMFTE